ncbi:NAD-dependent protein deacylase [Jeotgalibaca porci]|uniref:NAD-dependent protein deacylase n=1 Tax=Jeotgalibaca porci TaxID=1868793 RepID=UPI0035A16ECC
MEQKAKELAMIIEQAQNIVAFTGAGISTGSGIPDFRSSGGVFDQISGRHYSGEEALSAPFFERNPALFYKNFSETLSFPDAKPNFSHSFFYELEKMGKNVTIVTQNVDGLHEMAGNSRVLDLHGSATRWLRVADKQEVAFETIHTDDKGIMVDATGERVRPDIVLYGEQLDYNVITESIRAISEADLLIVVGTSLQVSPANTFVETFRGKHAVLINRTKVPMMDRFTLIAQTDSDTFFKEVWNVLEKGART